MKKLLITLAVLIISCGQVKTLLLKTLPTLSEQTEKPSTIKIKGVVGTVYHLVANQCDSNPFETADGTVVKERGEKVNNLRYVALSRDLLKDAYRDKLHNVKGQWKGKIQFGDTIKVVSDNKQLCGMWIVKDCMNKRFKKKIDFMQDKETGFYGKWNDLTIELI